MDDALAGTRVLIAGGEPDAAEALGAKLAAGADVIVAIGAAEGELRDLLDPLELRSGPPLVSAAQLDPQKKAEAPLRLRALIDRAALDRRARDLESALAAQTV